MAYTLTHEEPVQLRYPYSSDLTPRWDAVPGFCPGELGEVKPYGHTVKEHTLTSDMCEPVLCGSLYPGLLDLLLAYDTRCLLRLLIE